MFSKISGENTFPFNCVVFLHITWIRRYFLRIWWKMQYYFLPHSYIYALASRGKRQQNILVVFSLQLRTAELWEMKLRVPRAGSTLWSQTPLNLNWLLIALFCIWDDTWWLIFSLWEKVLGNKFCMLNSEMWYSNNKDQPILFLKFQQQ